ncbi:hypothetical protein T10_13584, partial [Trichinella papuae]
MKDNRKTSDSNPEKAALENNQLAGTEMKHQPNEGGHEEAKSASGEAGFPEAPRSTNE